MKSILFIPIKEHSERIPRKNFAVIGGRPLYQIFPMTAKKAGVFELVVIDTDSDEITEWAQAAGLHVMRRAPGMASNEANGNTLLRHHVEMCPGYDAYWQGFITVPGITADTIRRMHYALSIARNNPSVGTWDNIDSVMTVRQQMGFFWSYDGQPINHRPEVMPRSQDLPVLYQERHGLFGILASAYERTRCRAGVRPMFWSLSDAEDGDLDWPNDLEALRAKAGCNPTITDMPQSEAPSGPFTNSPG